MSLSTAKRFAAVTAVGLTAALVPVGTAAAEHAPEFPDDPHPPHTAHDMTVEVLATQIDSVGTVTVTGTVVCDEPGQLELDVYLTQARGQRHAYGEYTVVADNCPTTSAIWTAQILNSTEDPFLPGRVQLTYIGDEFVIDDDGLSVAHSEETVALILRPDRGQHRRHPGHP